MNKLFIFAFAFILCIANSNGQPKNVDNPTTPSSVSKEVLITGKVIDKETQDPLEYATIAFFSKKKNEIVTGGITDINGNFSIPVKTGVYDISIEYIAYKTQKISNKELKSDENIGVFSLEVDFASLGEVEIIAERTTVEIKLDKKIYNVGKDLTVSGGTVSDVLDNVPSVSVDAEGNVALRGNDNVRILINGKPSGLVGLNSTDALKQLPAESIEKVEVITSPSARYEAEGTAGILNIILRRSKLLGLNGAITGSVGHPDAASLSGNVNYRTGNINLFNTTSYRYRESIGRWYNDVKYNDINTPDLDEKRDWTDVRKGFTTNAGIEWYINDSASLTSSIVYNNGNSDNNSVNNLVQFNKLNNTTSKSVRKDPESEDRETIQYSLNFTKNFEKTDHKLTFDFQFEDSNEDENSLINVDGTDTDFVTTLDNQSNVLLQSDYTLPIGEMSQFEMGFRGDFSDRSTDYTVELLNTNTGEFEVSEDLSNLFNFKQYVTAVYTQYGSKIDKFSFLLGLRLENTRTTLDQPTSGDFKRKNLTGLFPTANLNYEFSDSESMTLGYNRRLRRPRGFMLNPFPSRSSLTNVFQGNPDLDPTYSDKFELGYLNRFGKFTLSTAVYYEHSTNVMSFVSRETGETVIIDNEAFPVIERGPVNLATDKRSGFEFNLNYSPTRNWRVNTDFNLFKLKRAGEFNGIDLSSDALTWRARLTNKLTLPYKIDWQTNMNYRGPSDDAQNNRKGRFSANMAFSKDLFKDKASIAFNVRDVLNSAVFKNHIITDTFTSDQEIQFRGGRTYNLAFTYRFNQKKKRERNRDFDGGDMEM
ncbi:TonB-dependent receptor domain-containing protein [Hwangdonia lutea]|uniref:TonB-dependent receptor n=1 Tax=Hwangdonia lutea TaxID=3075823 RepID=A0AA97ENV5_9FLAO|nr:TonB-dependent receptor [Hwangdonia sp. SCSIO 19198]WOD43433.1 TonB-dependent receptor [Hwangdonia sp. SCSIO 19198]